MRWVYWVWPVRISFAVAGNNPNFQYSIQSRLSKAAFLLLNAGVSLRLEMLQVARLAPRVLGEASDLIKNFVHSRQNEDGGFQNRAGESDLYYTVFAMDALAALQAELPSRKIKAYLECIGGGEDLDFVHVCCLARCWSAVASVCAETISPELVSSLGARIESFRAQNGGYATSPRALRGTAYGAFLAMGAHQDLGQTVPNPLALIQSLKYLEAADGAWVNETFEGNPLPRRGSTNATAAAVTVLRNLSMPVNPAVGDWLLARAHPQGGFCAAPGAPVPDLLSTATALHALSGLERDFSAIKESCLDYVDSLWTNEGAFYGHWNEAHLDCEYTFYGLLALGHLSL